MVDTTPFAVGVRLTDLPLPDDAEVDATTDAAAAAAGEESEDEEGGKAKKRELNRTPLLLPQLDSHTPVTLQLGPRGHSCSASTTTCSH